MHSFITEGEGDKRRDVRCNGEVSSRGGENGRKV